MEVAGLVLGGIPILLYAFDNYKRCLAPGKHYWEYQSTLSTIRSHMFVQQEQLDMTLRDIGLVKPTRDELEQHLSKRYSKSECAHFLEIVDHMERAVRKTMDKLDIDMEGKPRWTSDSGERASWEWRRIRRSLGHRERDQLVNDLQYWNTALKNIFEKAEIPSGESTPFLEKIQAGFNQKNCDTARRNYQRMHEVLCQKWACNCQEHEGNIQLDWHASKMALADKLSLTMPSHSRSQWHCISMNFRAAHDSNHSQPTDTSEKSRPETPRTPSPSRFRRLKGLFSSGQKKQVPAQLLAVPRASENMQQSISNETKEIQCLCDYLKSAKQLGSGYISDPNADDDCLLIDLTSSTSQKMETASLSSFLGLQKPNNPSRTRVQLSRKQRFSIAAAAVWAILYLCGSPWMGDNWDGKNEIQLFVEGTGVAQQLAEHPTLGYIFRSTLHQQPENPVDPTSEAERFQGSQIRNKALFALGILLIELCLNTTFEQIRRESQEDGRSSAPLEISSSVVDDFEIANSQTDRVYLEAGDSYGYAVQRCLRCEFPGRDVTKTFEFSQFRQNFFNGVVAPVQATYMMLPASLASM
ncbi:hypothetical protein F5Y14DRAFT_433390 [Nemania sp. NC0429]|nr:hypothetical protein F5Y14DRAFT_433390 [Nemania sp. NC0429]